MLVRQGHRYVGGASAPFFVSSGMIVGAAMAQGFDQVQVWNRDEAPPLPFAPPSDDYDTVAMGRRVAPDGELSLPSEVAWVVDLDADAPAVVPAEDAPSAVPPGPARAAPPSSGMDVVRRHAPLAVGGALAVGAALLLVRLARRG